MFKLLAIVALAASVAFLIVLPVVHQAVATFTQAVR